MSAVTDTTRPAPVLGRVLRRGGLVLAALVAVMAVAVLAGGRFGLMLAIGLGLGITLEGLRFGFAGPWRAMSLSVLASGRLRISVPGAGAIMLVERDGRDVLRVAIADGLCHAPQIGERVGHAPMVANRALDRQPLAAKPPGRAKVALQRRHLA